MRRWRAYLGIAAVMVLLLVPVAPPGGGFFSGESARNLLHVPLFAVVTFLLRSVQLAAPRYGRSLFVCALAAAFLGALSEIAQSMTGRNMSVVDFCADLSGILLACAALAQGLRKRVALALAGGLLLAVAVRPLLAEVNAIRAKRDAFPSLLDAGNEIGFWQPQGGTRLEALEGGGLEVRMATGSYEGLRHSIPDGVDTAGYPGLMIETRNPGDAFELGVRMDEGGGRRRNGSVVVPPGRAVLRVEWASGRGDGELERVVLFTGEGQPARSFRIFAVRLVSETSAAN